MAAEVVAHVMRGGPLPVSPLDALEAGILALAMDEARRTRQVVDLRPVWDRFDGALAREGGLMLKGRATTTLVAWAFLAPALLYVLAIVAWPLVQTVILSLHQRLAAQDHRLGRLGELREDLQPDLRDGHRPDLRLDLLLGQPEDADRHRSARCCSTPWCRAGTSSAS